MILKNEHDCLSDTIFVALKFLNFLIVQRLRYISNKMKTYLNCIIILLLMTFEIILLFKYDTLVFFVFFYEFIQILTRYYEQSINIHIFLNTNLGAQHAAAVPHPSSIRAGVHCQNTLYNLHLYKYH